MPRVKGGFKQRRAHKKILTLAKGYRMSRNRLFRTAHEAVVRAGENAFAGRRQRRRDMRVLWIARINGALTQFGIQYSRFMAALTKSNIDLNRKMLAEVAVRDPKGFEKVVEEVKAKVGK
jgi:large subunit ribosomal protein L20